MKFFKSVQPVNQISQMIQYVIKSMKLSEIGEKTHTSTHKSSFLPDYAALIDGTCPRWFHKDREADEW